MTNNTDLEARRPEPEKWRKAYGLRCECGHLADDHTRLPGHPDGAMECYGTDDCECGVFITGVRHDR